MSHILADGDWEILMTRIQDGKCTPFLGAGACYETLPLARDIALKWAETHEYPLEDIDDLCSVAQYLAITRDPLFPKEEVRRMLKDPAPPNFKEIEEPHGLIAKLPLPVYITTNYDDFMCRALQYWRKEPNRVLCQWNKYVKELDRFVLEPGFKPDPDHPIVFHLHGLDEVPESLVLTEDDYVDFLVNISRDQMSLIPSQIQRALTGSSLLFIGYSLKDWSFRVVFRGLVSQMEASLRRISIAVQLPKDDKKKESYLSDYFGNMNIRVFWGNASEFTRELRNRWEAYQNDR